MLTSQDGVYHFCSCQIWQRHFQSPFFLPSRRQASSSAWRPLLHLVGVPPHLNWSQLSILEEKNWQAESLWSGKARARKAFLFVWQTNRKTFLRLEGFTLTCKFVVRENTSFWIFSMFFNLSVFWKSFVIDMYYRSTDLSFPEKFHLCSCCNRRKIEWPTLISVLWTTSLYERLNPDCSRNLFPALNFGWDFIS